MRGNLRHSVSVVRQEREMTTDGFTSTPVGPPSAPISFGKASDVTLSALEAVKAGGTRATVALTTSTPTSLRKEGCPRSAR
ncbi:hypothetical protein MTO96_021983 [Rhipicephalus appendiculatus]